MRDKRTMTLQFLRARKMRSRDSRFANRYWLAAYADFRRVGISNKAEADLPTARKLDIDLGEQLSIEKSAVSDAEAPVHTEPCAKRVEAMLCPGMPSSGQHQSIDHSAQAHHRPAAELKLVIQEAEVERRVVRNER
jgi:hypothetical protein